MSAPRIPPANASIYRAALVIFEAGPQTTGALFASIDFGKACFRHEKIENAIRNGWLTDAGGKIGISDRARAYFGGKPEAPAVKYIGQVATTREPYVPAPLSKRNIPSALGNRDDVPAYSVRFHPSFKSVAGCKS